MRDPGVLRLWGTLKPTWLRCLTSSWNGRLHVAPLRCRSRAQHASAAQLRVRRLERREKKALSIIADMSPESRAESIARVLSALSEPGGGRRLEAFALARPALSFVSQRARLVLGLLSNASQSFARVLSALGEAGCGLAHGQSSIGRLARHCVGSRARPKTICFAGTQRHLGR